MMTIKILHTADWHLGAPGVPPLYFDNAIRKLKRAAIEENVDYVLVVGDIFDQPRPDQKVKDFLLQTLLNDATLRWVFTVGNHDYADKAKSYHSLRYLQLLIAEGKLPKVAVLEPGSKQSYSINDQYITFHAVEKLEDIKNKHQDYYYVPCYHGMIPNMDVRDLGKVSKDIKHSVTKLVQKAKASYIALGDIHKRVEVAPGCVYPGSLLQKTYSDEDGYCIVHLEEKAQYYPKLLDTPKKHTLAVHYNPGVYTEYDIIKYVKSNGYTKGSFCKLIFNLPISAYSNINQELIQEKLAGHCLEVKFDNKPVVEHRIRKEANDIKHAKGIVEEIDIVIDNYSTKLDKTRLKKTCSSFIPR